MELAWLWQEWSDLLKRRLFRGTCSGSTHIIAADRERWATDSEYPDDSVSTGNHR